MSNSIVYKIKNAGLWQLLQTGMQALVHLGYTAIMARLLSRSDFGLMAIAGGFISLGILFSEAGMGSALIQRKNVTEKHEAAALQGSILSGLFIFAVFYFASHPVATFFKQPELAMIIKVIGITIMLSSVSSISIGLLQKHFRFRATSLVTSGTTLAGYGIGVFLAFRGMGVWSLVAASVINAVLSSLILLYLAPVKISRRFHLREFKELFAFGSGIMILRFNNYLGGQGLNLMLGKFFLPAQLGLFERSNQLKNIPAGYMGNILDSIMFPAMSEVQDDRNRLFSMYQYGLGAVNTVLIPVTVYLIIFAREVVLILLGNQWLDAVLPLQIMFIVLPFSVSGRMADSVVRARGFVYRNVRRKVIYIAVLFSTVSAGGHFYGVTGAAAGVTFSFILNYCLMLFLVKNIFHRSIKEIFFHPVVAGLKLAAIALVIAAILSTLFYNWQSLPVLKFLIISLITFASFLFMTMKHPAITGIYLQAFIEQFVKKNKDVKQPVTTTVQMATGPVSYSKAAQL